MFVEAGIGNVRYRWSNSPFGRVLLAADDSGIREIRFERPGETVRADDSWSDADDPLLLVAASQLEAYFDGRLKRFDLRLAPVGTAFQLDVWKAVEAVPYGRTTTYGKIASAVGRTDYVRVAIESGRVVPIATSGASILSSTVRAAGCVIVPRELEGMPEGAEVEVLLYG